MGEVIDTCFGTAGPGVPLDPALPVVESVKVFPLDWFFPFPFPFPPFPLLLFSGRGVFLGFPFPFPFSFPFPVPFPFSLTGWLIFSRCDSLNLSFRPIPLQILRESMCDFYNGHNVQVNLVICCRDRHVCRLLTEFFDHSKFNTFFNTGFTSFSKADLICSWIGTCPVNSLYNWVELRQVSMFVTTSMVLEHADVGFPTIFPRCFAVRLVVAKR